MPKQRRTQAESPADRCDPRRYRDPHSLSRANSNWGRLGCKRQTRSSSQHSSRSRCTLGWNKRKPRSRNTSWHRDACAEAINDFRQAHIVPLAVCSCTAEYEHLSQQLKRQGAVLLQPLTTLSSVRKYPSEFKRTESSSSDRCLVWNFGPLGADGSFRKINKIRGNFFLSAQALG